MSYQETLNLSIIKTVVPYSLVVPSGILLEALNAAMCSGRVTTLHGWAASNVRSTFKGLSTREMRKGSFAIHRINQSTTILEGGLIDTFVTNQINSLLAFCLDFGLDQNTIEVDQEVFQMNLWPSS